MLRPVSVVGIGQIPVQKQNPHSLRQMAAKVVQLAMADARVDSADALFAGNMLADELQGQKHIAALIADEAGLAGIEALQVRAATATGAAALRMAYFAVASGEADIAIAVGVEKMSGSMATAPLAKSLDSEIEIPAGATMISKNAELMAAYIKKYNVPNDGFVNFAINAHHNALTNPNALFHKPLTPEKVLNSREIFPPIRLMDCSPICEGAAAVILTPRVDARAICADPVHILASSVATDRFRIADRPNPLDLAASKASAETAFQRANITCAEIDFFEAHDAFSIMACLQLEAVGFAEKGHGWRMAADGDIFRNGRIPIATMGGLKARGHPIGASAIYQTCEIVQQLTNRAGENQLPTPTIAMLQSIGGAAATVLTHIFGIG